MSDKRISLRFFQLVPTVEETEKDARIKQLNAISTLFNAVPGTLRPASFSESRVYLYGNVVRRNGVVLGTFLRNQVSNIPPSYDETEALLQSLPFTDNQGLAYQTSFLYDPDNRILMLEVNKNGVGISTFCGYINQNFPTISIQPALVIDPQKLQDFYNMTTISKLSVKIAKLENGSIFNNRGKSSLGQIIRSADNTNTDTLEYALSARGGKSLNRGKISGLIRSLMRYDDDREVQKLLVVGKEDDEAPREAIDLIDQKLQDSITVQRVRLISNFPVEEHYTKLEKVYAAHRPSLKIYKIKAM